MSAADSVMPMGQVGNAQGQTEMVATQACANTASQPVFLTDWELAVHNKPSGFSFPLNFPTLYRHPYSSFFSMKYPWEFHWDMSLSSLTQGDIQEAGGPGLEDRERKSQPLWQNPLHPYTNSWNPGTLPLNSYTND